RPAAGTDRRGRLRCADPAQAQGALPDCARPDAPSGDGRAAQTHGRQDHRQARRLAARDAMTMKKLLFLTAAMATLAPAAHARGPGEPASCDGVSTPEIVDCVNAKT